LLKFRTYTSSLAVILLLLISSQAFGLHYRTTHRNVRYPKYSPKHKRHLRRVVWNPLFRGSHESMLRQNEEIDRLGLPRIADDMELERLEQQQALVPIDESKTLRVEGSLDPKNRYCRSWTRDFLNDFSADYYNRFHQQIQVNSAVRTVEQQHRLRRFNHNAAPESGDTSSSHLAGTTVDISKHGMTRTQRKWVGQYLYGLNQLGLVEGAEERRQPVFHVMVGEDYSTWRSSRAATQQVATN